MDKRDAVAEFIDRMEETWFLPESGDDMHDGLTVSAGYQMRSDLAVLLGMLKALHAIHQRDKPQQ
ncbi:MAG: hypothetical protein ACR2RF_26105 [Geminicoccaceae bacterium]